MKTFLLSLSLLLAGFASSAHAAPDLTAWNQFDVTQTTAAAGSSVSINFQVANLGNAASGAYSIRFYLSADTDINPATDYSLSSNIALPSLNALTFSGYSVTLTLPTQDDLTTLGGAGTYHIGMVLDSLNQVAENNEGNNRNVGAGKDRDSLSITIPLPDLIGWDGRTAFNEYFAVLTSNLAWGDVMHFRFAVLNQTGGNSGAFTVKFYLSADSTITSADYQVGSRTFSSGLKGQFFGGSQDDTFVLPAVNPVGGAGTSYYFGMIVDADNQVAESNEANNASQGAAKDYTTVSIVQPQPTIVATDSVTPLNDNAINFGSVAVDGAGQSRGVQTLTILNNGKASLNVTGITVSGSAFSITDIASSTQSFISTSSLPRVIAKNGGESWVFTVQYDPTVLGAGTGTLTIATNDPVTPNLNIALSGTGSAVPDIALTTPEAVETDFGGVVNDGAGGTSATLPIVLKNTGSGPLTVSQNGISFLTGTQFSVVSISSSTQGVISLVSATKTIAANSTETWTVQVRFDPTALGQLTDGLRVLSDDPDEATFNVSLRGTGLNAMHIAVTDSSGSATDKSIAYPNTHADGVGKVTSSATVTLKNSGDAPLTISQNGITILTGTHFSVASITSDKAGPISLTSASKQIAGSNAETWTIAVLFDPTAAGALTDTMRIASNDPAAATTNVALSGTGLNIQDISLADSVAPNTDNTIPFGTVLNDGAGATEVPQIVTLTNLGTQPLIIAQNGIVRSGSSAYRVVSIVSSTDGAVEIASASAAIRTISTAQTETWTITAAFDPAADGAASGSLDITSNDPDTPVAHVALTGTGATPSITVTEPSVALNVSAGSVFNLKWLDTYGAGNATVALFLDADTNPANGLIPVASGISEDDAANLYAWQADAALVGGTYHVYATITAGSVTRGAYAPGTLKIDAAGSFQLRSSVEVTSPDYAYEFQLNGKIYQGVRTLNPGENVLTIPVTLPDGSTATERFTVNLVPSLTHKETTQVDKLNRVEQTKNGNGITTTITYDQMNRPISRQSSNGALVTFTYDVQGHRTSMTDYTGTTFYEWDDLSRMTAVITSKNKTKGDSDDLALRYEYDKAGRRTAIVYPGGERIEYTFDNAGRMTVVNNVTRSLVFNYTYNPTTGLLTKLTRPNGIETINSYDGMGRLTTIRHQKTAGAVLVAEYFYTLDAAGKATELRTTLPGNVIRREGYSYDRFDRLIQVIYADDGTVDANDRTQLWTYDANGNRLTQSTKVNNVVTEVRNYSYGNENRLLKVTDQTGATIAEYKYDAAGNRVQKITPSKTTNYAFDERNLMTNLDDGASSIIISYNGDSQRVSLNANGVVTVTVNDPTLADYEIVQERNGSNGLESVTMFGAFRLISIESGDAKYPLLDRLSSVRLITDSNGLIIGSKSYDAFGNTQ